MYDIDYDDEGAFVSSHTPFIVRQITLPPMNDEEINNSPIIDKIPSERHCFVNSVILEEEHPSSYNIEEIFASFTFDLHRREVSQKKYRKLKHIDGTMREIKKDEVLFEKTDEDPMLVATTSAALNQANILNISFLNEIEIEVESENQKLKYEIIGLKEEIRKMRKVDDHLIPLKQNILEEQEQLHVVKV